MLVSFADGRLVGSHLSGNFVSTVCVLLRAADEHSYPFQCAQLFITLELCLDAVDEACHT